MMAPHPCKHVARSFATQKRQSSYTIRNGKTGPQRSISPPLPFFASPPGRYGIARLLRLSTSDLRLKIPTEDLPSTQRLVTLCQVGLWDQ